MKKFFAAIILVFCLANFANAAGLGGKLDRHVSGPSYDYSNGGATNNGRSVLPKRGDIAVVVTGDDPQHVKTAEAIIIEMLRSNGYRVVDEAKMRRIRQAAARAQAARYALEGNVDAIMRINANYSAAATVVARVSAGYPVVNEFNLYTGTASAAIMAVTSRGTKLGGKTSMGKQIGYTDDEASYKAISAAVESGMSQMF